MAFVGVNTQVLNSNNITVATPAGAVGDILIFGAGVDSRTATMTWPSGFTPFAGSTT